MGEHQETEVTDKEEMEVIDDEILGSGGDGGQWCCGQQRWGVTEELLDLEIPPKNLGSYVVAVYEEWILEISGDQSQVAKGYTRLKNILKEGTNSFAWSQGRLSCGPQC
jgi:hypothetical protein